MSAAQVEQLAFTNPRDTALKDANKSQRFWVLRVVAMFATALNAISARRPTKITCAIDDLFLDEFARLYARLVVLKCEPASGKQLFTSALRHCVVSRLCGSACVA